MSRLHPSAQRFKSALFFSDVLYKKLNLVYKRNYTKCK